MAGTPEDPRPLDGAAGSTRERVLRAAAEVLRTQGPAQLKARVVADKAGESTTAIYYHFGGVPELVAALVERAFTELRDTYTGIAADVGDPVAQLFAMALCTRDVAVADAHLYDLMFGLSTRGTYRAQPSDRARPSDRFAECYALLEGACRRLVDSGRLQPITPAAVAAELWSAVHGFVTLEAAGQFAGHVDPLVTVLRPLCTRIVVGMGDSPDRARDSAATAVQWWVGRAPTT
ncbi:TetR/AcrR family transcriptional regulator [Rhodococcus aerolatus]